ncbi:MAG: radical SAM protein [Spirochaetaceae bacterium]|nr:radical SAM protein [Spirochaetaceae bacterium]
MIDSYNRKINYLRISLTQRCNYKCIYCHPNPTDIPIDSKIIIRFINILSTLGIEHIRFTGGEPLIRKDILNIIEQTRKIDLIKSINITSNGSLLDDMAPSLLKAGTTGLNISIDATDKNLYSLLSGGHNIDTVIEALKKSLDVGLNVKINSVLLNKYWKEQVDQLFELGKEYDIPLKFIELMPIGLAVNYKGVSSDQVIPYLKSKFGEPIKSEIEGNGPANYMNFGGVNFGFIDALSHNFCSDCNRLRLLSNGDIKLCLYQNPSCNVIDMINLSDLEIKNIFTKIIQEKNEHHNLNEQSIELSMASIGG